MQLTGTNSSIDLIILIDYIHQTKFDDLYRSRQFGIAKRLRGRVATATACSRMLINGIAPVKSAQYLHKDNSFSLFVSFADLVVMA